MIRYKINREVVFRPRRKLIIPTQSTFMEFVLELNKNTHYYPNRDQLFDFLLSAITYRTKADENIGIVGRQISKAVSSVGYDGFSLYENNSLEYFLERLVSNTAHTLMELLEKLDAYNNDYLVFTRERWIGNDLMMSELFFDEIPEVS